MKVLVIVLGSIAGLVILSIVAIAILLPLLGKKLIAANKSPVSQRATLAKIADFTVPTGFGVRSAIDLGIIQTAVIMPVDRKRYNLILQLNAQHLTGSDDKTSLDSMAQSLSLTEKFQGCDLKPGPDETIEAAGKAVTLRTLSCDRNGRRLGVELGLVRTKASTVQLVANDLLTPEDHAALVSIVGSMR